MVRWSVPREVNGDGHFRLRRRDFAPSYLKTYEEGRLKDKVEEALSHEPSSRFGPVRGFMAAGRPLAGSFFFAIFVDRTRRLTHSAKATHWRKAKKARTPSIFLLRHPPFAKQGIWRKGVWHPRKMQIFAIFGGRLAEGVRRNLRQNYEMVLTVATRY